MNAVEFIERIADELGIQTHIIKQGNNEGVHLLIYENGLSITSKTDKNIFISYQTYQNELDGQLVQPSEKLLKLIIDAYKNARLEIYNFNEQRRILQIQDWELGND